MSSETPCLAMCSELGLQLLVSVVPQMSSLWDERLFLAHSIILLLSHVAPLAFSWHNAKDSELWLETSPSPGQTPCCWRQHSPELTSPLVEAVICQWSGELTFPPEAGFPTLPRLDLCPCLESLTKPGILLCKAPYRCVQRELPAQGSYSLNMSRWKKLSLLLRNWDAEGQPDLFVPVL